jgi:long-chain acyl-CoA synthetase
MSAEPLFQALAAYAPDTLVLSAGEQSWRAADMLAAIDALGASLVGCHRLAVLADNGPAWVMADLTALRESRVHIPLPGFFSDAQLVHALTRTACDALLTDQPERIAGLGLGFAGVGSWCGLQLMTRPDAGTPALPFGTAKVSFTSGSTGQPKGVCLSGPDCSIPPPPWSSGSTASPSSGIWLPAAGLLLENVAGIYAALLRGAQIHLPGLAEPRLAGHGRLRSAQPARRSMRLRPNSLILVPELLKAWSLYLALSGQRGPDSCAWSQSAVPGWIAPRWTSARARPAGLPGLWPDRMRLGGQPQPSRRATRRQRCRRTAGARPGRQRRGRNPDRIARLSRLPGRRRRLPAGWMRQRRISPQATSARSTRAPSACPARKHLLITAYGRNIAPEWVEAACWRSRQSPGGGHRRSPPWLAALLVPMPAPITPPWRRSRGRGNAGCRTTPASAAGSSPPFTPGAASHRQRPAGACRHSCVSTRAAAGALPQRNPPMSFYET